MGTRTEGEGSTASDRSVGPSRVVLPRRVVGRLARSVGRTIAELRLGRMRRYVRLAARTPGWTSGAEARELARASRSLAGDAVVVEIGAFMGATTIILAGARHGAGRGMVHTIDPFDGSGDAYSVPVYRRMTDDLGTSLRERFDRSIAVAGVADRSTVHEGTAESVIVGWDSPIDLLFMDGDHSPAGASSAFDLWEPWVRTGGLVVFTNSAPRDFAPEHDGQFLVASRRAVAPWYTNRRVIGNWTFAERTGVERPEP